MLKRLMIEHDIMIDFIKIVSAFYWKTINVETNYVPPYSLRQTEAKTGKSLATTIRLQLIIR